MTPFTVFVVHLYLTFDKNLPVSIDIFDTRSQIQTEIFILNLNYFPVVLCIMCDTFIQRNFYRFFDMILLLNIKPRNLVFSCDFIMYWELSVGRGPSNDTVVNCGLTIVQFDKPPRVTLLYMSSVAVTQYMHFYLGPFS